MAVQIIMKTYVLLLLLMCSTSAIATNYYFSNTGSDSNNGLSTLSPKQTLTAANALTLASGDSILFKRGDTFTGFITVQRSGISYGAYGTGANPIITGFETITGWVSQGNGIYRAITNADDSCNVVSINGVNMAMGRYPNTTYLTYESYSGDTLIIDDQMTNTPNWTGAELVIKRNNWTLQRGRISDHTNSTFKYSVSGSAVYEASSGNQYFIQHDIKTLDVFGEWYCDGTYLYMYFGAANPSSYTVKASVVDRVFSILTKNSTAINDLTIEGGNLSGIYFDLCTGVSVENCTVQLNGFSGINGDRSNTSSIDSCNITNNSGYGIKISCTSHTLSNSIIDNNGMSAGMGNWDGSGHTGVEIRSTGGIVEYNTVSNSGYNGINFYNSNFIVRYNKIDGCNSLLADGGAIYTYIGNTTTVTTGQKIYNNIVLNSQANGIYCDQAANGIEIYNNTVISCAKNGFHGNDIYNLNIHDNNLYQSVQTGLSFQTTNSASGYCHDNAISGNTIVNGTTNNSFLMSYRNLGANNLKDSIGTSNLNVLVGSAANTTDFYNMYTVPGYILTKYSFTNWKTLTGKEANSSYKLVDSSDTYIAYNATNETASVQLPSPMKSLDGATYYSSTITLQPYTSLILIKNIPNPSGTKKPWGKNGIMYKTKTGLPIGGE